MNPNPSDTNFLKKMSHIVKDFRFARINNSDGWNQSSHRLDSAL